METCIYAVMLTFVALVCIGFCYVIMRQAMADSHEAWKHAVHVQDDHYAREIEDRRIAANERKALLANAAKVSEWNSVLTSQLTHSAKREIGEVQRYMEVVRQDLVGRIYKAARESCAEVRKACGEGTFSGPSEETQKIPAISVVPAVLEEGNNK